ncbi:hypothetical protein HZF24_00030 [Sedimentibacter hydroxybenzoicus DSM 7310]|uniref:Helix-turn-helix domain-containing protein n=1 Tax=Sedimentibacter hydroxybenzoicus DSM 7310 TaxID=1123245 RepID=A0A974BGM4_SEDHY|nr:hypothetical protein [Sedimentibacter hydroxybenzoicus]NYB72521.1 hypothetical protein [Sedimentibacter hydroxybenzoicus DSM 7310]
MEGLTIEEKLKQIIKEAVKEVLIENGFKQESKNPEVLCPKELAAWLGVSQAWISVNKDKLNIPYFQCGGDKFYRADIEKWIEQRKNNAEIESHSSIDKNLTRVTNTRSKRFKIG